MEEFIGKANDRSKVSEVKLGDSRALPLQSKAVDAVIGSPPYCTRVDYFRATQFELAALGIGSDSVSFRDLRERAMGTNLIRASAKTLKADECGPEVGALINRIGSHPSKASNGYYLRNYRQYFVDAFQSLSELKRVLRPNSPAVLVVQSSYYKEIPIDLGGLYVSMFEELGVKAEKVQAIPVKRSLAQINGRAAKYVTKRQYTEDVVLAVTS
jgi:hypothetical protein